MEGSAYLKARREWDERYADLVAASATGRSPPAAGGTLYTVRQQFMAACACTRRLF